MDRTMKVFFFFCFVVFFFTGCGKNNQQEKVNGPNSAETAKNAMQLKAETQTKDLEELSKLLRASDRLFTQVWIEVEQNPDANPENVFRVVRTQIDTIQRAVKQSKESPEKAPGANKTKAKHPLSVENGDAVIFISATPKSKTSASESQKDVATQPPSQGRISNGQNSTNSPRSQNQNKMAPGKNPAVTPQVPTAFQYRLSYELKGKVFDLAAFEKTSDGTTWRVQFMPGNLGGEFNGLGRLSMVLNENEVICDIKPTKQGRLEKLECTNIGQDLNGHKTVKFNSFRVNTLLERKLQVAGEIKEDANTSATPTKFAITDYDKENRLVLDITEILESVESEKAADPGTAPAQPAPAGSESSNANSQGGNPPDSQGQQNTQEQDPRNRSEELNSQTQKPQKNNAGRPQRTETDHQLEGQDPQNPGEDDPESDDPDANAEGAFDGRPIEAVT